MPAYVLCQIEVTDPIAYERYKAAGQAAVAAVGGRYVVRGGEPIALEGEHDGRRIVLLEFPDLETARRWYDSERYREAREIRKDAARFTMLLLPGFSPP